MTDYTLIPEEKQELTEKVLGETYMPGLVGFPYTYYGITCSNRPFATFQDQGDLVVKLVEMGLWNKFIRYALNIEVAPEYFSVEDAIAGFCEWLMTNPSRFCKLVAQLRVWEGKDADK